VVQDIIPYTCIIEKCDSPDEMYLTAEALLAHTLDKHSFARWTCDYCAPSTNATETSTALGPRAFETAEDWMKHVANDHGDAMSADERPILADLNKRQMIFPLSCPLCPFSVDYMDTRINDHILLHMHEFSLLALPEDAWGSGDKTTGTISQASEQLSYTTELKDSGKAILTYDEVAWSTLSVLWLKCQRRIWLAGERSELLSAMKQIEIPNPPSREMAIYNIPWPVVAELSGSYSRRLWEVLLAFDNTIPHRDLDDGTTATIRGLLYDAEIVVNAVNDLHTPQGRLHQSRNTSSLFHLTFNPLSFEHVTNIYIVNLSEHIEKRYRFVPPLPIRQPSNDVLEAIEEIILFPHQQPKTKPRQPRLALVGPPVTGVSSYAVVFAHQMLDSMTDCFAFWIDASTIGSVQASYDDIAILFGAVRGSMPFDRSAIKIFMNHLNWTFEGNWFVVFDGLTRESALYLTLENLVPQGLNGSLLITTADAACLGLLNPVETLEIPEADWMGSEDIPQRRRASVEDASLSPSTYDAKKSRETSLSAPLRINPISLDSMKKYLSARQAMVGLRADATSDISVGSGAGATTESKPPEAKMQSFFDPGEEQRNLYLPEYIEFLAYQRGLKTTGEMTLSHTEVQPTSTGSPIPSKPDMADNSSDKAVYELSAQLVSRAATSQVVQTSQTGVLGHSIKTSNYALPSLKDWEFIVDNEFPTDVLDIAGNLGLLAKYPPPSKLCARCSHLDFTEKGFVLEDEWQPLRQRATSCVFCKLLLDVCESNGRYRASTIKLERRSSNLYFTEAPLPALSICCPPSKYYCYKIFQSVRARFKYLALL
jgi:hypothetical protein